MNRLYKLVKVSRLVPIIFFTTSDLATPSIRYMWINTASNELLAK